MTRRLVLTADDLGEHPAADREIQTLLAEGAITATTMIVLGPAAARTAATWRGSPAAALQPRLHATLTSPREARHWHPLASGVDSLTDDDGDLLVDPAAVAAHGRPQDVTAELAAQLAWMHAVGLRPAGLDSHSGVLYGVGGLLTTTLRFCAQHGLSFRLPRILGPVLRAGLPTAAREGHARALELAGQLGVRLPETIATCWLPGEALKDYDQLRRTYLDALDALPDGTSELFCHPAPEEATAALPPAAARKRSWELELLRDPQFTKTLEREDIELVPTW